ncbi:MAG: SAM-dependent methyltransferase, partial [Aquiluna sp.]
PLQEKAIRHYLTQQDIGRLEIKKRGVDIEPELLRKRLKLKGSGAATLIATKVGGARKALVCHEG